MARAILDVGGIVHAKIDLSLLLSERRGGLRQTVSGGAIVGAPVLNVTSSQSIGGVQYTPQSLHVTVGGSFQLDFPWRLRLETHALYRPASYSLGALPKNATALDWKFPVMMEYKFNTPLASGRFQPFAGAGVELRSSVSGVERSGFRHRVGGDATLPPGYSLWAASISNSWGNGPAENCVTPTRFTTALSTSRS